MKQQTYIAIDLKSFYASVECLERGLDPLTTNLVVADATRTEKTICLAVTPSLKAYGLSGRSRLFEVVQTAKDVYNKTGKPLEYIIAPPRMQLYIDYSTRIFNIYMKYVSPDDIHVYSIDEVFIDATSYLELYKMSGRELAEVMVRDVLDSIGITATAGVAPNLYLCKIAMDIVAKHIPADEDGVRIAAIDETSYKRELWDHQPITDFWRIGSGISKSLRRMGVFTMGDLARMSLYNEDGLYKAFGKDAELLIDHAWGYEPCTIKDIKSYTTKTNSLSSGQVLQRPYSAVEARIVIREMTEAMILNMVDKGLVSDSFTLHIGYDRENVDNGSYSDSAIIDRYGRRIPKPAHGSVKLIDKSSSTKRITEAVLNVFDEIVDDKLLIRRINVTANNLVKETVEQFNLFSSPEYDIKEKNIQKAVLDVQKRYGKNAMLKGTDLQEAATTISRNSQIGGHKA